MLGQGPTVPTGSSAVSIDPPSILDESLDEDDDETDNAEEERPLNRDEIAQRVNKRIAKRGSIKVGQRPGSTIRFMTQPKTAKASGSRGM